MIKDTPAMIALEDGTCFHGRAFSGQGEITGEIVFNTSMTGYQEILTDPSHHGQVVTLTYPLIGNYGINEEDMESWRAHPTALVIGECSRIPSNWRCQKSLPDYLAENNMLGIDQVDTRAITVHIRSKGAMKCAISTEDLDPDSLVRKAQASPGLVGWDLSTHVSATERYRWEKKGIERQQAETKKNKKVAVIDCGVKYNQLRIMASLGFDLEVFPNHSTTSEILSISPDGIFISNGPGDPEGVPHVVQLVKELIEEGYPTFGICFGHQLIGLALGGKTYKLKFGHRGANHPVKDLKTGRVSITSQNHGFCVDKDSLDPKLIETTHIHLNDQTSEGLRHKKHPVFSVQYHPEAAPGPNDATYLFHEFETLMSSSIQHPPP
ncbi:MAG: glutamine-hydrolyzing carbamoyl-phosphate synthase small subunit [Kiritimatiellae bacterium]|nr:glutamine-hydrolyzing carbamoyl-phosphate synthase small subunit [Kiritimatiellia bacterium]